MPDDYQLVMQVQKFNFSTNSYMNPYIIPFYEPNSYGSRSDIPTDVKLNYLKINIITISF